MTEVQTRELTRVQTRCRLAAASSLPLPCEPVSGQRQVEHLYWSTIAIDSESIFLLEMMIDQNQTIGLLNVPCAE